jgi:two-component sensor histidine kinase
MSWTEHDGPPVQPPDHQGFGTTVIESMVKRSVSGEVQLNYASSGLEWRLTSPATNALEQSAEGDTPDTTSGPTRPRQHR